jgi:hypothetical protein
MEPHSARPVERVFYMSGQQLETDLPGETWPEPVAILPPAAVPIEDDCVRNLALQAARRKPNASSWLREFFRVGSR